MVAAVERESVDLTVVGPEVPLVAGLVDALAERGHTAFGPSAQAARTAAYAASKAISFEGMQLRTDIAANAQAAGADVSGLGASPA